MDSSISRRSKCQPSQETWKVTGLTWASFPWNNSLFPLFFLLLPVSSECHGPPLPPQHPTVFLPPTQHSHLLSLTYANVSVPFILLVALSQGEGRGLCALSGSCMHFTKLTPRWLPDFLTLSFFFFYLSPLSPQTSYWIKEQKEGLLLCIFGAFCCEVWRISLNKWLMDLMHLDSISTVGSLPQWLAGL